jgi:hypothetical protein
MGSFVGTGTFLISCPSNMHLFFFLLVSPVPCLESVHAHDLYSSILKLCLNVMKCASQCLYRAATIAPIASSSSPRPLATSIPGGTRNRKSTSRTLVSQTAVYLHTNLYREQSRKKRPPPPRTEDQKMRKWGNPWSRGTLARELV